MIFFVTGFALLLHVGLWGAGLAALATPRPWRRFWPVFVPLCGFALQTAAVQVGSVLHLGGTNFYAWPAEMLPLVLLVLAVRQRGGFAWMSDWGRFSLPWMIMGAALVLLLLPLAIASHEWATPVLGGAVAPFVSGARVLMVFPGTTSGDFFPFAPAALIALNASCLRTEPSTLTVVLTAVAIVVSVPVVFWIGRAVFGYSAIASLVISSIYAISPITWYSFGHVTPTPLLVAPAVAVLNWAAVVLWNGRLSRARVLALAPLLVIAFSVVLGTPRFVVLAALVPAAAFAGTRAVAAASWHRLLNWITVLSTAFIVAGVINWNHFAALFTGRQGNDVGSRVPPLGPEGWLGVVRGPGLEHWPFLLRWPIAVICVAALSWAIVESLRRKRRIWVLLCVLVPIIAGYTVLEIRAMLRSPGASYDAYQLFAVFYPLLLPAFCWWITLRWSVQLTRWLAVAALAALLIFGNLVACAMSVWSMAHGPRRSDDAFAPARHHSRHNAVAAGEARAAHASRRGA